MPAPVLLSRGLDPVLGIFTGCFAYYLHETHPRTAPPPDKQLGALREEKLNALEREAEASSRVVS
ncbi:hypothetical protein EDB19DRAFT_1667570 [Suillus lakei]|nr:hypothetical protein EDB19DRAFT_1667570 [Suillus lakei]